MPRQPRASMRELLVELALYAVLVVGYLWGVLLLIGDHVVHLSAEPGITYAVVALALIVGQGLFLDIVVASLLRLVRTWLPGR